MDEKIICQITCILSLSTVPVSANDPFADCCLTSHSSALETTLSSTSMNSAAPRRYLAVSAVIHTDPFLSVAAPKAEKEPSSSLYAS